MVERKLKAVKSLVDNNEEERSEKTESKANFVKQMDKLQKELKSYEDMHLKLQDQVTRKDENLKKHTEVVEKLYSKYKDLCIKVDIEPRIRLEKNAEGVIDVTLVD